MGCEFITEAVEVGATGNEKPQAVGAVKNMRLIPWMKLCRQHKSGPQNTICPEYESVNRKNRIGILRI